MLSLDSGFWILDRTAKERRIGGLVAEKIRTLIRNPAFLAELDFRLIGSLCLIVMRPSASSYVRE